MGDWRDDVFVLVYFLVVVLYSSASLTFSYFLI